MNASDAIKLSNLLSKLTDNIGKLVQSAPSRLAGAAGGLAGSVGGPLSIPGGLIDKLIAPIGDSFGKIANKINSAMGPIISMVGKMNPALVQMFEFAMDDLMAIMGQSLQPILQAVIGVVRQLGDMFATLQPVIDPVIQSIAKLVGIIGKMIEPIAKIAIPIFQLFGAILEGIVIPIFEKFVDALKWLADGVLKLVNKIIEAYNWVADSKAGRALGLSKANLISLDSLEKKTAQGTAIRETQRTSAEDLGARTREASFGQTQKNMLEVMGQVAKNTNNMVAQIAALLGINEEQVRQLAKQFGYNLE